MAELGNAILELIDAKVEIKIAEYVRRQTTHNVEVAQLLSDSGEIMQEMSEMIISLAARVQFLERMLVGGDA